MKGDKKIKDVIALEIYELIKKSGQSLPLDGKYLVVEFNDRDGKIDRIRLENERKKGDKTLCVDVERASNGKEIYRRIREELENTELEIDIRFWKEIGNAYDWVWGCEYEEQ